MNSFFEQVYAVVERIPCGKVVTYGQISWMLGRPRSARMVGMAMCRCPQHLPFHRVVMSDGSIAGGVHSELRKAFLESEGVPFLSDNRVDLAICRWNSESYDGEAEKKHVRK